MLVAINTIVGYRKSRTMQWRILSTWAKFDVALLDSRATGTYLKTVVKNRFSSTSIARCPPVEIGIETCKSG